MNALALETTQKITPERLKMSYAEYLQFAPDARIAEWVDGEVMVYMPPTPLHQKMHKFLSVLLVTFIERFGSGSVVCAT